MSMDHNLPLRQKMAIWFHLRMCKYCSMFRDQLLLIRKISTDVDLEKYEQDEMPPLSEDAKKKIKKAISDKISKIK